MKPLSKKEDGFSHALDIKENLLNVFEKTELLRLDYFDDKIKSHWPTATC